MKFIMLISAFLCSETISATADRVDRITENSSPFFLDGSQPSMQPTALVKKGAS